MATYYWRGGAGTWDATTTTNWSTTSGGLGGAGPPTSADNVIFDTLSNATAYAVTIGTNAVCLDVTIAGPAVGNVTITSSATSVINVFGSWTNAATGVAFTTTNGANISFNATTTGKTITTNNVTLGTMGVYMGGIGGVGVGGGWTLGSNYTSTGTLFSTAGNFSTANFTIAVLGLTCQGTVVRSVSLGSSAITCTAATGINISNTANLTFNAGTSTITATNNSFNLNGGGLTYYNVIASSVTAATHTIQGTNTFNNLTFTSRTTDGIGFINLSANQTINGTLTIGAANTAVRRLCVRSDVLGTQRTLTVATIATLADVDFQNIVAAGASGTWSGTRLGNCLGNTNITFGAGVNKYWSTAAGISANWSGTTWATSSGGTAAVNNFPLAQDTCIIDNSGATTGDGLRTGNTVTIDANWNMGTLSFSGRTVAFNWTQGNFDPTIFGNVTLTSSMTMTTVTGTPSWIFSGSGLTQTVDSAGITLRLSGFIVDSFGGTVSLARDTTVELIAASNGTSTLTQGTLSLGSYTLTTVAFTSSNSNIRTLAFGTGKIVVTANAITVFTTSTATNLTVTGTAPLVESTYSGSVGTRGFIFGPAGETNAISLNVNAGSDQVNLSTTSGAYKNVNFTGFTGTVSVQNSILVFGNWNWGGTTLLGAGVGTVQFAATSGTKTITSNGQSFPADVTFNGVGGTFQLQDALTLGSTRTTTLTAGTLNLSSYTLSTGLFTSAGTNTLAFGTGNITLTGTGAIFIGSTTTTVTGTPQVICTDNSATARSINPGLVSEANAISFRITAGTGTFAMQNANTNVLNLDFTDGVNPTGFGGSFTAQFHNVYGNFKASTNMTSGSGNGTLSFIATSGTKTVTTAGVTFDRPFGFNGVGGTWQLQDALTLGSTRTIILNNGTLNLNNYTATAGLFDGSGATARTLAFGTSNITLTGLNTTVWSTPTAINFSYTGTPTVNVNGAGILGETRTISHGSSSGGTEANAPSFNISAGADSITTTGNSAIKNLNFTGFTGTLNANGRFIYGNLILVSGMTLDAAGVSTTTFAGTSGTQQITTAGQAINFPITFNGLGGTFAFQDALTLNSLRTLTFTNGTLQLKSGVTSTVGSFVTSGTTQKFLQSTLSGTQATISQASGTVSVSYLTIKDSNATGGATFNAYPYNFNSDAGNNTGWNGLSISNFATGNIGNVTYNLSIALIGVNSTGAVGTVGLANQLGLTGNVATGNTGTIAGVLSKALTGTNSDGNVGTVGFGKGFDLTGVNSTGAVGTIGFGKGFDLTGVNSTGSAGIVTGNFSKGLSGDNSNGNVGTVGFGKGFDLTGVNLTGAVGTVTNGVRTVGLTGDVATGNVGTPVAVYWKPINTEQTPSWTQINTQN